MGKKDKQSPDQVYGPKIVDSMADLAEAVSSESGAGTVYVTAVYTFKKDAAKGTMELDIRVSPDATMQRFGPDGELAPRVAELQDDKDTVFGEMLPKIEKDPPAEK